MKTTNNSVLPQINGFHYQVLLGVQKCYELDEGQSIYFERDGDLSIEGNQTLGNVQIEVKHYDDELNNKHENFWKTLANWLEIHDKYQHLILHTTQPFSSKTSFNKWNTKTVDEKLKIIQAEYKKLTDEDKDEKKISKINKYIVKIAEFDNSTLRVILKKFYIFTESENLETIKQSLLSKPTGIPKANQQSYLDELVGFIYSQTNNTSWTVSYDDVQKKFIELTSKYCVKKFTFPEFTNNEADQETIKAHADCTYFRKIEDIGLVDEIPLAVGNLSEFITSLKLELDNHLLYREKTKSYKQVVKKKIKSAYTACSIKYLQADVNLRSKAFYEQMTADEPYHMDGYGLPPMAYKNGSLHDIMDDDDEDYKWKVD